MLLNYHIGRLVLSSLCVGDLVRLGLSSARVAGFSLQHGHYSNINKARCTQTVLQKGITIVRQQKVSCSALLSAARVALLTGYTRRNALISHPPFPLTFWSNKIPSHSLHTAGCANLL